MIKTISTGDSIVFETKVNALIEEGYSIMSTNCGYVGEIGNEVYDCEYWMAILNKRQLE